MRRRLVVLVVIGAAAVAFFVLRGGGGARQVEHGELVAEVNDVCSDLIAAVRPLEPPFRPYGTHSESYFAGFLGAVEEAKGRLEDLEPPAEDRAAFDTLVDGYTAIESDLEEAQGAAAVDQDPEVTTRIAEIESETKTMAEAEQTLGVCAGETSITQLPKLLRRTVPNPLEETGEF